MNGLCLSCCIAIICITAAFINYKKIPLAYIVLTVNPYDDDDDDDKNDDHINHNHSILVALSMSFSADDFAKPAQATLFILLQCH